MILALVVLPAVVVLTTFVGLTNYLVARRQDRRFMDSLQDTVFGESESLNADSDMVDPVSN